MRRPTDGRSDPCNLNPLHENETETQEEFVSSNMLNLDLPVGSQEIPREELIFKLAVSPPGPTAHCLSRILFSLVAEPSSYLYVHVHTAKCIECMQLITLISHKWSG